MNTQHSQDRWPLPVITPPRGIREQLWVVAIVAPLAITLLLPGGWYVLVAATMSTALVQPWPRHLAASAVLVAVLAGLALLIAGDRLATGEQLLANLLRSNEHPSLSSIVATIALDMVAAMITISSILGYDTRRVRCGVVLESVWDRQKLRRTQVLRSEARNNPPPLVTT